MNVIGNFEFCVYIDPLLLIYIYLFSKRYFLFFVFLSSIFSRPRHDDKTRNFINKESKHKLHDTLSI